MWLSWSRVHIPLREVSYYSLFYGKSWARVLVTKFCEDIFSCSRAGRHFKKTIIGPRLKMKRFFVSVFSYSLRDSTKDSFKSFKSFSLKRHQIGIFGSKARLNPGKGRGRERGEISVFQFHCLFASKKCSNWKRYFS